MAQANIEASKAYKRTGSNNCNVSANASDYAEPKPAEAEDSRPRSESPEGYNSIRDAIIAPRTQEIAEIRANVFDIIRSGLTADKNLGAQIVQVALSTLEVQADFNRLVDDIASLRNIIGKHERHRDLRRT